MVSVAHPASRAADPRRAGAAPLIEPGRRIPDNKQTPGGQ